ncbi:hypothetical protein BaRGS_00011808 [Batillaria attramentaria]|uniref:Major facilitator superfamily domain-containing protein 12-like n=1 Tax=Batillaria attramentaria TaxID=370345 RepID=A0ABD0LC25_9CAEN
MAEKLLLYQRLAFSMGHIQNDLLASMWFSYLLVYLHQVRHFDSVYTGTLLLVGQVVDGITTALVGFQSDATNGCFGYTKRKSWHLFGTLCTTLTFPFIFSPVLGATSTTPAYAIFIYYSAFVTIFQIGWACIQNSQLSLIPELTSDASEIAGLNGWMYAGTGFSNLLMYSLAWAILCSGGKNVDSNNLTVEDSDHFQNLGIALTLIGLFFSVVFHVSVRESRHDGHSQGCASNSNDDNADEDDKDDTVWLKKTKKKIIDSADKETTESGRKNVCEWFTDCRFYQVALVYMCTRLFVNISQVYLPMYLTETVHLDKATIANVPLACYASSFVMAIVLKVVDRRLGRMLTYVLGVALAVVGTVFLYLIPAKVAWMVYITVVFIGIGGALMQTTALSIVADLIGDSVTSGAFVYGSISFVDKVANGAAVEIIEILHPCKNCCPACEPYFRVVQSVVPGVAALVGLTILLSLNFNFFTTWRGAEVSVSKATMDQVPFSYGSAVKNQTSLPVCNLEDISKD